MSHRCRFHFTFLFLIALAVTPSLSTADRLKVGLSELDYPPFYFVDDGELKGAAVEIAEQVAQELGHELEYLRFPWARVQYFLRVGQVDMVILYFKTEERAQDAVYTNTPHIFESSYLAVPSHMDVTFDGNLASLKEYSFLSIRGYWHGKQYDQADYLNKFPVNDESELVKALASRRNFIGVGNKPALLVQARALGVDHKIRFLSPPIDRSPDYMAFSKANPEAQQLASDFSDALEAFMTTDAYRAILDQYSFD